MTFLSHLIHHFITTWQFNIRLLGEYYFSLHWVCWIQFFKSFYFPIGIHILMCWFSYALIFLQWKINKGLCLFNYSPYGNVKIVGFAQLKSLQ